MVTFWPRIPKIMGLFSTITEIRGLFSTLLASKTGVYPGEPIRTALLWEYPPPPGNIPRVLRRHSTPVKMSYVIVLTCIIMCDKHDNSRCPVRHVGLSFRRGVLNTNKKWISDFKQGPSVSLDISHCIYLKCGSKLARIWARNAVFLAI